MGDRETASRPDASPPRGIRFGSDTCRTVQGEHVVTSATDVTRSAKVVRVGVPIEEAALTALIGDQSDRVLPGHSESSNVIVLHEVELGVGRPDVVVLRVDFAALALRRHARLRLNNLTEARTLGAALEGNLEMSGVSLGHTNRVLRGLEEKGWLDSGPFSRVVDDSVLIEAKVAHWGLGIGQLARVRWAANHAALLVPASMAGRVPAQMLQFNEIGLLTDEAGSLVWTRLPPRRDLPMHLDAWLGELVLRSVEAA